MYLFLPFVNDTALAISENNSRGPFLTPKTLNSVPQDRKLMAKSESNRPTKTAVQASTGNHGHDPGGGRSEAERCYRPPLLRDQGKPRAEPPSEALI